MSVHCVQALSHLKRVKSHGDLKVAEGVELGHKMFLEVSAAFLYALYSITCGKWRGVRKRSTLTKKSIALWMRQLRVCILCEFACVRACVWMHFLSGAKAGTADTAQLETLSAGSNM